MSIPERFKEAGFKILGGGPPDPETLIKVLIGGIRDNEEIYGPLFSKKAIEYALKFISSKTGESAPSSIETLEQLAGYLVSSIRKYPRPYCALLYAEIRAEVELQGEIGAAIQISEIKWAKRFTEAAKKDVKNDIEKILLDLNKMTRDLKVSSDDESGYRVNDDGTLDMVFTNCYFKDVCEQALAEGLKRTDGRKYCPASSGICRYFRSITGYEWDYDLLEFNKPYCTSKIYMF
ncbi:MAG: hypothetical protein KIH01_05730 [Candidatus Freyarchaeota archaeon]|nr:hypothetical protein [Candidatus Jordarchaeia archaeon]